jgi:hypothetical protein
VRLNIRFRGRRLRPVLDWPWNERNRLAALRMVGEIKEKIRHGVFDPAAYFPEYRGLSRVTRTSPAATFGHYAELWQRSLSQKAPATRQDYEAILERAWLPELRDRPVGDIRYSDLVAIIAELAVGGKTLNKQPDPAAWRVRVRQARSRYRGQPGRRD